MYVWIKKNSMLGSIRGTPPGKSTPGKSIPIPYTEDLNPGGLLYRPPPRSGLGISIYPTPTPPATSGNPTGGEGWRLRAEGRGPSRRASGWARGNLGKPPGRSMPGRSIPLPYTEDRNPGGLLYRPPPRRSLRISIYPTPPPSAERLCARPTPSRRAKRAGDF